MRNPALIPLRRQEAEMRYAILCLLGIIALSLQATLLAQVPVDPNYKPTVRKPAYAVGTGPVVGIDEAHGNTHTAGDGFAPFAKLLNKDGYRVVPFTNTFTTEALRKLDVLVIINAGGWTNQSLSAAPDFAKARGATRPGTNPNATALPPSLLPP